MELGDYRIAVCGEIGLTNTAGHREQLMVDKATNEGVVEFLRLTKCHVLPFSTDLVAGDSDYELDTNVLSLKDLYVSSTNNAVDVPLLRPVSGAEIVRMRRYPSAGSAPAYYSLEGANLLRIFPAALSSDDTLQGLYVPRPTKMTVAGNDSSDSTYGGVPEEFSPAVEAYAKWKAATWDDDTSSQIGLGYKAEWLERVKEAKISLNQKAGKRWAPARPKRRRGYPPVGPGVDTGR